MDHARTLLPNGTSTTPCSALQREEIRLQRCFSSSTHSDARLALPQSTTAVIVMRSTPTWLLLWGSGAADGSRELGQARIGSLAAPQPASNYLTTTWAAPAHRGSSIFSEVIIHMGNYRVVVPASGHGCQAAGVPLFYQPPPLFCICEDFELVDPPGLVGIQSILCYAFFF